MDFIRCDSCGEILNTYPTLEEVVICSCENKTTLDNTNIYSVISGKDLSKISRYCRESRSIESLIL